MIEAARMQQNLALRSTLAGLATKLHSCKTVRQAVKKISRVADKLWGWDAFFLHFFSPELDQMIPILNVDTIDGKKREVTCDSYLPNPQGRIFSGRGILLNDYHPRYDRQLLPFGDVTRPSASRMYVSIRETSRTIAYISIQSYTPHAYDEDALEGLEILSDYCTAALARFFAEAQTGETEARFRSLAEATTECIFIHGEATIFEVNANASRVFGYSAAEFAALSLNDLLVPADSHSPFRNAETTKPIEGIAIRKRGEKFPVEVVTRPCRYRGKAAAVTAVRDITHRKRIEEQLRSHSRQLLETQESERRRVSRDLHDSVNQILTASTFSLDSLRQSVPPGDHRGKEHLDKARSLVLKAMSEIRLISWNLRPNELDNLGLIAAIQTLCRDCAERTGMNVTCEISETPPILEGEASVASFRILQEALGNASRHSGATEARVHFATEGALAILEIIDNGRGFVLEDLKPEAGKMTGLGLVNMRERAKATGGDFAIHSSPGAGTTVRATFPVKA